MADQDNNTTEVVCLWDYENGYDEEWLTNPSALHSMKNNIEKGLKLHKPNFVVTNKIVAFGPDQGSKFRSIQGNEQLLRDIEVRPIPFDNKSCDSGCGVKIVSNILRNEELIRRKTDTADKYIALEMINLALQGIHHILVISNDCDFHSLVGELNKSGSYIMLATNNVNHHGNACAKQLFRWSSLLAGLGPLR